MVPGNCTGAPRKSYSDVDTVISEDESGVGGGELGGRHCDGCDREIGREVEVVVVSRLLNSIDGVEGASRALRLARSSLFEHRG
jgi:hypothetical protein